MADDHRRRGRHADGLVRAPGASTLYRGRRFPNPSNGDSGSGGGGDSGGGSSSGSGGGGGGNGGWPPKEMRAFDPAMGRGYRIGDSVVIPALAGFPGGPDAVRIVNHGDANRISRWKITLNTSDPNANDTDLRRGSSLQYRITASMENEVIPRRATVTVNDSQVVYAPGRTIEILAFNRMPWGLVAQYSLDEVTAGMSRWKDAENFEIGLLTTEPGGQEFAMDFPPFCSAFEVFTKSTNPGATVRAYNGVGTMVYSETVAAPRSNLIIRIPGCDYTIEPPSNNMGHTTAAYSVYYTCDG